MRPTTRVALASLALVVSACGGSLAAGAAVAATVNGEEIPTDTLAVLVRAQTSDPEDPSPPAPEQYGQVQQIQRDTLAQLIQDEIVAQAATELGIDVSDQQVEERFQDFAREFEGEEGLREEIRRRGRTEADVRGQIAALERRQLLEEHFSEQDEVDAAEVRAAYRERLESQYTVANVAHILVEERADARRIIDQLRAGADFAQLAREHSQDQASARNAGSLGENPRGTFVEEFDAAVWNAEPGEIVGPVQTRFGFHVIRVDALRELPFQEVEQSLRQELAQQASREALDTWLSEALASADVHVAPRFGRWDPTTGRIVADTDIPTVGDGASPATLPSPQASPTG
ncbi:MAG TPA: peptidylprolyl isomerase [Nitriliruptorales bacterium]|nr:peptidylprolyl isomerase [Nitriliruptorales bacterium]